MQKVRKFQKIENTQASLLCMVYMYQYSYLVEQAEVLLSQFEWNSRDSPTETRLTDRYRSTDSLSFVTPANFPRAMTIRRMANDVTYTMYAALPIHLRVPSMFLYSGTSLSLYEDTPEPRIPLNRTPFPAPSTTLACFSTSKMRTPH